MLAYSDMRLRLREDLIRVPGVSVYWPDEPAGNIPSTPPRIVIEILSRHDRFTAVRDKLEEYRAWDVKHVWLLDPRARRMYFYDGSLIEAPVLRIAELDVEMRPEDVFPHTPQQ
jgi:Uma2 family endonuclease